MSDIANKIKQDAKKDLEISNRRVVSNEELLQMNEDKHPFLIDRLVPEKAITSLTSETGKGKSVIALKFAKSVALGEKLWGEFESKPAKVLIVDMEMNRNNIITRNRQIVSEITDIDYYYDQEFKLDTPKDYDWLEKLIQERDYKFIIFDTLSSIHRKEENSATEMAEINGLLLNLIRKTGTTILYLHHHYKTRGGEKSGSRGSTDIEAKVASHLSITSIVGRADKGEKKIIVIMTQEKAREIDSINKVGFSFYLDKATNMTEWNYRGELEEEKLAIDNVKDSIAELLKDGEEMTIKEIKSFFEEAGTPHKRETIMKALDGMVKIGTLIKYPGGTGKKDKNSREGSFALRTEEKEEADRTEKERDIFGQRY